MHVAPAKDRSMATEPVLHPRPVVFLVVFRVCPRRKASWSASLHPESLVPMRLQPADNKKTEHIIVSRIHTGCTVQSYWVQLGTSIPIQ